MWMFKMGDDAFNGSELCQVCLNMDFKCRANRSRESGNKASFVPAGKPRPSMPDAQLSV